MRMDAITNGTYVNNEAILTVNLAGASSATLDFDHADLGDEETAIPGSYTGTVDGDGVSISADGTQWYSILTTGSSGLNNNETLSSFSVNLVAERDRIRSSYDSSFDFTSTFKIKFQQYDNYAAPSDGREWDNVVITGPGPISLNCPSQLAEASNITCTVSTDVPVTTDTVITINADAPLNTPTSVTISNGQTDANFILSVNDDTIVSGNTTANIAITAPGFIPNSKKISIIDDDSVYTVTFDLGIQGTLTSGDVVQQIPGGSAAIEPSFDVETGWSFTGWDTAFNFVTETLVVTAQYEINTYTVTFELGDYGSLVSGNLVQTIVHGTPAVAPVIEDDIGWNFTGWDVNFDNVTNDLTITALYEVKDFPVTFVLGSEGIRNGGGALIQSIIEGQPATAPVVEGNTGWYFKGWDIEFSNITKDTVITAQYLVAYTVTFDLGSEGTLLNGDLTQKIVRGNSAIAPDISTIDGWVFAGWNRNYSNVIDNLIVTAQYLPKSLVGILEQKGLASDGTQSDSFGNYVSISGDTALIGAHLDGETDFFLFRQCLYLCTQRQYLEATSKINC